MFTSNAGKQFRAELTATADDVYDLVLGPLWPRDDPDDVTVSRIYVTEECDAE